MASYDITRLKNVHPGDDIWVIGSGPSAGFVDPEFFTNKISVGVNYVWQRFPVDYVVIKENFAVRDALENGQTVVASRYHCGDRNHAKNRGTDCESEQLYIFDHLQNNTVALCLDPVGKERQFGLVVSFSSITSAIHLAAYMGAKNIILVGHDCGAIDGNLKMPGYFESDFQKERPGFYADFIRNIEPQTLVLRDRVREVYGCQVYSLNPWINLGLEGHKYSRKF